MFESYFGFSRTPFSKDIPPSAVFSYDSQKEALLRLSYAVEAKLICVLVAEVGMGKSLTIRKLVSSLDASRHTCIYLSNPTIGARGILTDIVLNLSEYPSFFKSRLIAQAKEAIEAEAARGRSLVLIVDEAHLLNTDTLEEIRLLTNFDMDSSPKFSLILAGQSALSKKLKFTTLSALEQRVSLRVRLQPLTIEETAAYIKHHLNFCGRPDALFSDDAIMSIRKASGGVPRRINNLSLHALMAGFHEKKSIIDEATAKRAIAEIEIE
jgi:type II secretory pathway predicted ATPase ExeA